MFIFFFIFIKSHLDEKKCKKSQIIRLLLIACIKGDFSWITKSWEHLNVFPRQSLKIFIFWWLIYIQHLIFCLMDKLYLRLSRLFLLSSASFSFLLRASSVIGEDDGVSLGTDLTAGDRTTSYLNSKHDRYWQTAYQSFLFFYNTRKKGRKQSRKNWLKVISTKIFICTN